MSKSKTTAAPALTYERVRIDSLSEDPANVRIHPERNLEAIKASLRKFGQQKPLVVDSRGIVVAGNGTLRAARTLGWEEIDVVRTELEGSEAIAFAIADNRTAELASWDTDALVQQLEAIKDDVGDIEVTGFTADEVAIMLAPPVEDPDDQWKGMPSHDTEGALPLQRITVSFWRVEDVQEFARRLGAEVTPQTRAISFPFKKRERLKEGWSEAGSGS